MFLSLLSFCSLCWMFNIGFQDLATLCVEVVPVFQHPFKWPWVRGRMQPLYVSLTVSEWRHGEHGALQWIPSHWLVSCSTLHPYFHCEIHIFWAASSVSFSLKVATGTCATALEQLQHMIQLNLKSQNYAFFVYSFTFFIFCFLCPLWLRICFIFVTFVFWIFYYIQLKGLLMWNYLYCMLSV
jgi:hypothetical protein